VNETAGARLAEEILVIGFFGVVWTVGEGESTEEEMEVGATEAVVAAAGVSSGGGAIIGLLGNMVALVWWRSLIGR